MRVHSLKAVLWVVFTALAGLVALAVGATFISIQTQAHDALIINLAGRQRMLLQQIDRQTVQLSILHNETSVAQAISGSLNSDPSHTYTDEHLSEMLASVDQFSTTLVALREGGRLTDLDHHAVTLAPIENKLSIQILEEIQHDWQNLQPLFDALLVLEVGEVDYLQTLGGVQKAIPALTTQSENLVSSLEQSAEQKLDRLRWIQIIYLGLSALVIVWGIWLIRRKVLAPLQEIDQQVLRITAGDLKTPLQATGMQEIEQIGAAMEKMRNQLVHWNKSLEIGVDKRTRELEAFTRVSQEIVANLELDQVLKSITDKTRQLLGCEVAFLCLHEPNQENMHLISASCGEVISSEENSRILRPADIPLAEDALRMRIGKPSEELPLWINCSYSTCTAASGRLSPISSFPAVQVLQGGMTTAQAEYQSLPSCQILDARFQVSHLAAPLFSGERVSGALCAGSSQADFFDGDDVRLLNRLAAVASLALENARLFEQAERLSVLEERQNIAAEIHDGFIQTVNSLRLLQEQLEEGLEKSACDLAPLEGVLTRMRQASQQAEAEARKALSSLNEELPPVSTLQDQLRQLAKEMRLPGQALEFETSLNLPLLTSRQLSEQVMRIAKEAVLNAQKHAQADSIHIKLILNEEIVILSIEDDGIGFDPINLQLSDERPHFGLQVMQARAQRIGASLDVVSHPQAGAQVRLKVPLAGLINTGG
jgi:two-component system nitrate/nitrite sensor histidine kinase NarX